MNTTIATAMAYFTADRTVSGDVLIEILDHVGEFEDLSTDEGACLFAIAYETSKAYLTECPSAFNVHRQIVFAVFDAYLKLTDENKQDYLDVIAAKSKNKLEVLDTPCGYMAVFTGFTDAGEYIEEQEAESLDGDNEQARISEALSIWGATEENTNINCY